jgi:hypothetical protein
VKLDATGAVSWQIMIGGSGSDEANSIQQTADGGYIVAGSSGIVKLDDAGAVSWQTMIDGSGGEVQQTTDNGYIVAGTSYSTDIPGVTNHGEADFYIVKLNALGDVGP